MYPRVAEDYCRAPQVRNILRVLRASVVMLLLGIVLSACAPQATVKGVVLDIRGQQLPGVSVTTAGGAFASTDALGNYTLRTAPGGLRLDFHKTGYTAGWLELDLPGSTTRQADNIQLWPLPESKGVYLFQDFTYTALDRQEPRRYVDANNRNIFGVVRPPQASTENTSPLLIAHRLPTYDVHVHRLEKVRASLPTVSNVAPGETIWAPTVEIPVLATPIDEPDRLLVDLRFEHPLAPGDYAVHWGALQGFTTNDTRAFLLHIGPPTEATIEAPTQAPEGEKGKEKAKEKKEAEPNVAEF